MSLLSNWLNADTFAQLRDKVNAIVSAVNPIGGGTAGQVAMKIDSTDFNYTLVNLDRFATSSTTSNSIDYTGNKTFTVDAGLTIKAGNRLRAYSVSGASNFIEGDVVSYSGTSLVIKPDVIGGSGTKTDWTITHGGSTPYLNTSTTFSSISFTGGGVVTINSQTVGYTKINGLIHLSFKIDYSTSGGSYPCSAVTITLPTELTGVVSSTYGNALIHDTQFPFVIEQTATTLILHDGDTGNVVPGGANKIIYGTVLYPMA